MKFLIIHNNNLPKCFVESNSFHESFIINYIPETYNFDFFVHQELGKILKNDYDAIVIPYSLSIDNYIEYSGLNVAAHIRITKEWGHTFTPIVFIGAEDVITVAKISKLGNILFSPGMFSVKDVSYDALVSHLKLILSQCPKISKNQYERFLDCLIIPKPLNYATHHSIANEWAVTRWMDLFEWPEGTKPRVDKGAFLSMLYFKYLREKEAQRENREPKSFQKIRPIIDIDAQSVDKTIIYIDDEFHKGWEELLTSIMQISKIKLLPYHDFAGKDKNTLISDIKTFIDNNAADSYLLDLRLHDDDYNCNYSDISGHKIAEHIIKKNRANQIVIFTASNKVWNMREELTEIGATRYVIKESPEQNYTMSESKAIFDDFAQSIKESLGRSYLKRYVLQIERAREKGLDYLDFLDNYVDLLLESDEKLLNSCILNLNVFLESYLKKNFDVKSQPDYIKKKDSRWEERYKTKMFFHKDRSLKKVDSVAFSLKTSREWSPAGTDSDLTVIIGALHFYYSISEDNCNKVIKLRSERSSHVAHGDGRSVLTYPDLRYIFENVILKILNKDMN